MTEPLIINQFDSAIADSPHKGFGLMRCVDLEAFPGAVKVQKAPATLFHTAYSGTFTAVAATDVCTTATTPRQGTAVTFTSSGTLPAPLVAGTIYFIIKLSSTTFSVAATVEGSAINITDAGTGTHTVTTINPGTIKHIVKNSVDNRYFQDSNGRVWYVESGTISAYLMPGNTLTNASANGLVLFRNSGYTNEYLFVFRNASIDVAQAFNRVNLVTPTWTNAWQSMNTAAGVSNRHHAIVGQDNIVYFGDSRFVGSIREVGTFDPANAATYTYNNQALDMPQGEVIEHLDEQGTNLLAAGGTYNKIYPWDRTSDSYNLPINVPENQVKRIKNIGGTIYILAGSWGNIYTSQGTYVKHFKKIPDQLINNSGSLLANPMSWGGIDMLNGSLIFGVSGQTSANEGAYLLYPDGRLVIDQLPSTGAAKVEAFEVTNNFYYLGYSGGADYHTTSRYVSFEGVIQSALYRVATKTEKATYSTVEVQIAKPASSGHVRVKYRTDTSNSNFTDLITCTADNNTTSFKADAGIIDIENIQVQAEIDGLVELVEIRLLP